MKILHIGKFYPPKGGVEYTMLLITEKLNEKGYQADVLTTSENNGKIYDYKTKIYTSKILMKFASTMISIDMISKLKSIIQNYDVIHIHQPDPMATLALFLSVYKNKNIKIVVHWHSDIVKQKHLLKLYKPLQNWLLTRADIIIGTTPVYINNSVFLKKYLTKTTYVPSGIPKPQLIYDNYIELLKKYKNKKIVFSLGRLIYYKGFQYLIKAANYLPDDIIILIGGTGPLYNDLKEIIEKNKLQNKVELLGYIDNNFIGAYYELCDVFCLPSIEKSEAYGLVQLEAMSYGKPVISTTIKGSGVSWVNQDSVTGINVEPKNELALAKAIKEIVENQDLYKKFSENSLNRYNEIGDNDKNVNEIIKIYNKLLSET